MGRASRPKPARLAKKLLQIRRSLGLSQNEMIQRMGLQGELLREEISDFERGKRIPPLPVLLAYARTANVYVDTLIDDEVDLPDRLPSRSRTAGVRRK
jgi:transcriptional regulator with XRE-family HTH domain